MASGVPGQSANNNNGWTTINIRLASLDDLEAVQACARAAYGKYVERMDRAPAPMLADFEKQIGSGQLFVALNDSVFAGYVVFYPANGYLHLESVAVVPEQSGKGIGRVLVEYAEKAARDKGLTAVELYTNEVMIENLTLYPKLGYTEIARKQQDGYHRVFFVKYV